MFRTSFMFNTYSEPIRYFANCGFDGIRINRPTETHTLTHRHTARFENPISSKRNEQNILKLCDSPSLGTHEPVFHHQPSRRRRRPLNTLKNFSTLKIGFTVLMEARVLLSARDIEIVISNLCPTKKRCIRSQIRSSVLSKAETQ